MTMHRNLIPFFSLWAGLALADEAAHVVGTIADGTPTLPAAPLPKLDIAPEDVLATQVHDPNPGYQKMVDELDEKWNNKDIQAIKDWFNSANEAKSIVAQNLLKKPESAFKHEVVLAYLGGSPRSWGDLDPAAPPSSTLGGAARVGLIGACIRTMKLAAPGIEVAESDFQAREDRLKLAERFSKTLKQPENSSGPSPSSDSGVNVKDSIKING